MAENDRRCTENDRHRHSPVARRLASHAPSARVIDCDKPVGAKTTGATRTQEGAFAVMAENDRHLVEDDRRRHSPDARRAASKTCLQEN